MADYYRTLDEKPSQGDIVEIAPHARLRDPLSYLSRSEDSLALGSVATSEVISEATHTLAIILTPDCDIDKPSTKFWLIAPIHPISLLKANDQGNVRKNKNFRFLHLPELRPSLPESFVDFGTITTLESPLLGGVNRIATLGDDARAALYVQHLRWFSRWVLKDVQCPQCRLQFNPTAALPVRAG